MIRDIKIDGESKHIVLEFPSLGDALQLWKPWNDGKSREEITKMLHAALQAAGVSLEVRVQGKPIATLGGDGMSGLAIRLLAQHA
ncbi:MAG: hypothetical protein HYZ37_09390 [Candidatus Solibacter usitatus]|nr:hypothetical protein [Candidatus Solibacter usitatus]